MNKRPTVLIADDHRILAEGLRSLLSSDYEVLSIVEDGRALVETAKRLDPDVIVADISMPHLNGIEALIRLKKDNPAVKLLVLTMHHEPAYARRALDAGASGYVLKSSAADELLIALKAVMRNQTYITPAMTSEIFTSMRKDPAKPADPSALLTPRQREILQLLAEGQSAKQIGACLSISACTVEFHKYQMMEAIGLHTVAELVCFGVKNEIVAV